MDKSQLMNYISEILKTKNLVGKDISINENTSLYNECGINSISIIDLIVQIEERFNFEFNDSDLSLKDFETVSNIADIILTRISPIE